MALPLSSFHVPPEPESRGTFSPDNLRPMIHRAIPHTHALISGSPLVALGRGTSGVIYAGVNVELPGLPLHHSIHAEQFLVTVLALQDEPKLHCLAISTNGNYYHAPCGHCCQFLQEIRDASNIQIIITDTTGQNGTNMPLSTFLPQRFSPYNLVPVNVPRLLEKVNNRLTLVDSDAARDICDNPDRCKKHLKCRALAAANRAYAPYSKCPSGVALKDRQGKVYSGWCMESEAHIPSLGPVQAALVDFMLSNSGGKEFNTIVEAVLVEKRVWIISQEATARMILEKIAQPGCVFTVFHCD